MLEEEAQKIMTEPDQSGYLDSDGEHVIGYVVTASIRAHFINTGRGSDGLAYLKKFFNDISKREHLDNRTKANIANQTGMLAWVCDDLEACITYTKLAASLNSSEPAYLYNLALAYESKKQKEDLEDTLDALSRMSDRLDSDHRKMLSKYGFRVEEKEAMPPSGEGARVPMGNLSSPPGGR
jgi:hypothetical protein